MSSSPILSSTCHQAPQIIIHSTSNGRHHRTVYEDGRGRCIVESLRRSSMKTRADAVLEIQHHSPSEAWDAKRSQEYSSPASSPSYPSSSASSTRSAKLSRDNVSAGRSPKRPKPKVVIVTASEFHALDDRLEVQSSSRWTEPTPPPTSRLERLPTPELSDLDEGPFCDCDDESAQVAYCRSCENEARLLSSRI